jgi:DNA repair protein SbcC/Rad50
MNILLSKLSLLNFKGIRNQVTYFDGNTEIYGANEVGKSTIYTAFTWLLTGKDEFDRKDFEIKNTRHKELNSQAHEVEGIFIVNGTEVKLKRVYLEKWVKQKGESQKVFKGHETDFYYNDVPCSLSEYQAKVDGIIDSKIIKLVTNPTYFNSLKWEDQRRGLIGIAGEITNDDVFDLITTPQNDFGTLIMVLNGGKSLEEWKKELAAKKTLLKKAAIEYQPRIDEAKRGMPEESNWIELQKQVDQIKQELAVIDESLLDASKALAERQKGLMAKQKDLHAKQTELSNIRFKIKADLQQKQNEGTGKIAEIKRQISECNNTIARLKNADINNALNINVYQSQIDGKNETIARLRKEWDAINSEKFEFDESKCECPTCKQQLPEHDIQSKKEELRKNFNESVSRRKADKVAISNQIKAEIKQLQESIDAIGADGDNANRIHEQESKILRLNSELSELQALDSKKQVDDIEVATDALLKINADALNLQDEIASLEAEINSESEYRGMGDDNAGLKSRKADLQSELDQLNKRLSTKEVIEKTKARVLQLEHEEQVNAQAIADLEQQEFQVETFTRAKMDILENKVNQLFKYVKFKLFETQVNGGIAETCVCTYNGVPYPTLNTAAKLLAGLDVLNTLSKFYGVYAPVFCDNRESVTIIPESKSQIISLFVSPSDKELRVEIKRAVKSELAFA